MTQRIIGAGLCLSAALATIGSTALAEPLTVSN